MKQSHEQPAPKHGQELAEQAAETLHTLSLTDPRVQVFLAPLAFPGDPNPIARWVTEDEYSSRFRAYIEDPARTEQELSVDIQDREALIRLLAAVRAHNPEEDTVH